LDIVHVFTVSVATRANSNISNISFVMYNKYSSFRHTVKNMGTSSSSNSSNRTESGSSNRRMNLNSSRQSSSNSVSSSRPSPPTTTQNTSSQATNKKLTSTSTLPSLISIYIKSSCSKKLNDNLLLLKSAGEPGIDGIEIGKTVVPGLRDNYVPVNLKFVNEEELQNTIKWIRGLIGSDNFTYERPIAQPQRQEYKEQNNDKEKTIYIKRPRSIWEKTNLIRESGLKDIKTMTDIELLNDYSIYRLIGSEEAIQNAMKMIQDTIGKAILVVRSLQQTYNGMRKSAKRCYTINYLW
jgi:hypothetical protein